MTTQRPAATPRPATPKPVEPEVTIKTIGIVEPQTTDGNGDDVIDIPGGKSKGKLSGLFDKLSVIFTGKDNDEYSF